MRIVPIEKITIGAERQRGSFDPADIMELANSIVSQSLLHCPVVREDGQGGYILVAGERRMRAISELRDLGEVLRYDGCEIPEGSLPVTTLGELTPLEAEEAELEENVRRKDLTWQEHARAVKRLADLRAKQAALAGNPPPTIADIAKEANTPRRDGFDGDSDWAAIATGQELQIANHLEDPDVAKSKTLAEALKVVKAKETARQNTKRAEEIGLKSISELHDLHQGDSMFVMQQLDPKSFDVLITDPPYGMGADEFGDSGGSVMLGVHRYKDDDDAFTRVLGVLEIASKVAVKESSHAYIFCDIDRFFTLRTAMGSFGWTVFRTPLIWIKNNGRVPLPQHGPRRQYELILYAFRGQRNVVSIRPDTIECPSDENLGLGAQKPVEFVL
jgi:ParB-like chromosome segregation protein Spo0J